MLNAQICNSVIFIGHVVCVVSRTFQILSVQFISIGESKALMTSHLDDFMKVLFENIKRKQCTNQLSIVLGTKQNKTKKKKKRKPFAKEPEGILG